MRTESLNVTGMTCDGCTAKVAKALKALGGVHDVVVSLPTATAMVRFDEQVTSPAQLASAVQDAGYGVGQGAGSQGSRPKDRCCS